MWEKTLPAASLRKIAQGCRWHQVFISSTELVTIELRNNVNNKRCNNFQINQIISKGVKLIILSCCYKPYKENEHLREL